jgi:hypothetical protein
MHCAVGLSRSSNSGLFVELTRRMMPPFCVMQENESTVHAMARHVAGPAGGSGVRSAKDGSRFFFELDLDIRSPPPPY